MAAVRVVVVIITVSVDGAIHAAAGRELIEYNRAHGGCRTGDAKISPGYNMLARAIISTVGPQGMHPRELRSCYDNILEIVRRYGIRSVALCGISTGIYGYPAMEASKVALDAVREWLKTNADKIDRIVFVTFTDADVEAYETNTPLWFPTMQPHDKQQQEPVLEQQQEEKVLEQQQQEPVLEHQEADIHQEEQA